jgi:hypothetical protein
VQNQHVGEIEYFEPPPDILPSHFRYRLIEPSHKEILSMKKPNTKSPSNLRARLTPGEQAAQNIAKAKARMQADSAAGKDLADSATNLRETIVNSCKGYPPQWVIKFATGIVPSNKQLSDGAIELLTTLEKDLKAGRVDIDTINDHGLLLLDKYF